MKGARRGGRHGRVVRVSFCGDWVGDVLGPIALGRCARPLLVFAPPWPGSEGELALGKRGVGDVPRGASEGGVEVGFLPPPHREGPRPPFREVERVVICLSVL
jgi:hypothetical protein